jgi:hypothetical protein
MITGSRKKDAVFYSSALPPSSPDRLSSFGQGQAVTQVTGSSYTGAVDFGAGLPGDFDFAVFSLFLQTGFSFRFPRSKALNIGNRLIVHRRKSIAHFPSYTK